MAGNLIVEGSVKPSPEPSQLGVSRPLPSQRILGFSAWSGQAAWLELIVAPRRDNALWPRPESGAEPMDLCGD
jgi:hypothetical protein